MPEKRIGIIAGAGDLPIFFAKKAKEKGTKVIGFAIEEMASPEFDAACDRTHRLGIGQIKKFILLLFTERIKKIVMLGKVDKSIIYRYMNKDDKAKEMLKESKDKSDYTLLDKFTSELKKIGVDVIDGVEYLKDFLPSKGILTNRKPTDAELEDIKFGIKTAKEVARLDVGQTIIVKNKSIVSVEAMEGTDSTIERAAKICGEGFSVVKVARPMQDMRWDVPVVGVDTIKIIAKNKGSVLAMEEKKMFLVDKETCVELADNKNISIIVL